MEHQERNIEDADATHNRDVLLKKLECEIRWQWKWEKLNRHFYFGALWTTPICSFVVFALAICQVYFGDHPLFWITILIAAMSALVFLIPTFAPDHKWKSRQRYHDQLARKYEIIKMKLETGLVAFPTAMNEFERLHRQSPESVIQRGS
jgi:Flp pilus assembly protein TadB